MTSFNSISDLSRTFQLRLGHSNLKGKLDRLTQEVMTNTKSDIPKSFGGDISQVSQLEYRLSMISTYQLNAMEASAQMSGVQTSLEHIQSSIGNLGPSILADISVSGENDLRARLTGVEQDFRSIINTLNTSAGGRFLFSGSNTDTAPIGNFDDMMAEISAAVAGAVDAADIVNRINAWFDAPAGSGGFMGTVYQGDDSGSTRVSVSPNQSVEINFSANSADLRETLKAMSMLSYAASAGAGIDAEALRDIFFEAGARLVHGTTDLIRARANIGERQKIIEQAVTRNTSEASTLNISRSKLIGTDPYETATALKETETNIETLYALTARLSRLKLTDYL